MVETHVSGGRIRSLDGLRGLAAAIVVLGHTRLVVLQNYSSPLFDAPGLKSAINLLGVFGAHAVWLFFILSGLVLSRLLIRSKSFDYGNYLLGRLARLYIPVWAAVVFTVLTILLVSRDSSGFGPWVDAHPKQLVPWGVVSDMTLVNGTSGNLSPLWSLQWEVLFSLFLILYVSVLKHIPPVVGVAVSIGLSVLGKGLASPLLMYMAMFAVGTCLALAWDRITQLRGRGDGRPRLSRVLRYVGVPAVLVSVVILEELPNLLALFSITGTVSVTISMFGSLIALTAVVVVVPMAKPLVRVFESRFIQWLGAISFSLYLIHEPIILASVHLFSASLAALAVAVVLAFVAAHLFYRVVEEPSHQFSRRFSRTTPRAAVISLPPLQH